METVEVVSRPPTDPASACVIYQVTLAHGQIVTNPFEWGEEDRALGSPGIVAINGQVLVGGTERPK